MKNYKIVKAILAMVFLAVITSVVSADIISTIFESNNGYLSLVTALTPSA